MYENDIKQWALSQIGNCTFDLFVTYCKDRYYSQNMIQSSNISTNGKRSTKILGDLFEAFCKLYLKNISKFQEVWFLNEIPDEIKTKLNLGRDFGIDLIAFDGSEYHAVQCKYRTRNQYKQKTGIPWKDLSTFYALVTKTGPFKSHIVMTNVDYVRHIGEKSIKDKSICYGTFKNITGQKWLDLFDIKGNTLGGQVHASNQPNDQPIITNVDIREKRLAYFDKKM